MSAAEHEDLGEEYQRVRGIVASRVGSASPLFDDLVQEALIAWWRTEQRKPGQKPGYYASAARGRVLNILTGHQQMLGQEEEQRRRYRPTTIGVDWTDADNLDVAPMAADVLEAVTLAYHHGEIDAALADLTPAERDYVIARFWRGMTWPEIEAEHGARYGSIGQRWSQRIRPRLRKALDHLRDAA